MITKKDNLLIEVNELKLGKTEIYKGILDVFDDISNVKKVDIDFFKTSKENIFLENYFVSVFNYSLFYKACGKLWLWNMLKWKKIIGGSYG